MRQAIVLGLAFVVPLLHYGPARAEPVVYTLYGVTDGQLGSKAFSDAQIRLEFRADTQDTIAAVENGVTVYRNDRGHATIFITAGAQTTVARIAANQIFVRYDPTNAIAGFGSYAGGPFYPVTVGWCTSPLGCGPLNPTYVESNILGALGEMMIAPADSGYYPPAVADLATDLKGPALLTGWVNACLSYDSGNLTCPAAGPPIKTNRGDLYFQGQTTFGKGIFTAVIGRVNE